MEEFGRRAEDKGQESTRVILARIETKLDRAIQDVKDHKKENETKFEKIDGRVGKLENQAAKIWGFSAALGFISGLFSKWFFK